MIPVVLFRRMFEQWRARYPEAAQWFDANKPDPKTHDRSTTAPAYYAEVYMHASPAVASGANRPWTRLPCTWAPTSARDAAGAYAVTRAHDGPYFEVRVKRVSDGVLVLKASGAVGGSGVRWIKSKRVRH